MSRVGMVRLADVRCMSAERLLRGIAADTASAVLLDPPEHLGVGTLDDETSIDEAIAALAPVAELAAAALQPGGAAVVMGGPLVVSGWEVAASWAGLRLAAEMVVLWDTERRIASRKDIASLATVVRWHIKPGFRARPLRTVSVDSNVLVCTEVPLAERTNAAQRPVELYNYLISLLTEPGDLVVDPYCGSGSALVAAEMVGRRWLGGDVNPAQCLIATQRVARVELEEAYLRPLYLWSRGKLVPVEG